jgi:hypothetical protein
MWPALRAFLLAGLLVAGASAATVPARAEPTPPGSPGRAAAVKKARDHFQTGQRLYTVSRYREALEQFKNAFLEIEDPVFLYNIAQCHRLLGENIEAVRFYRRYVEAAPGAAERQRAQKWIAELEGKPPSTAAVAPPPARVLAPPPAPTPAPTPAPGPAPVSPPLAVAPSNTAPPTMSPPPPSPMLEPRPVTGEPAAAVSFTQPPPESDATPIYKRWWFWAGVGAVVLVGTVSAVAATRDRPLTCGIEVNQCTRL